jgi:hypothetical protein
MLWERSPCSGTAEDSSRHNLVAARLVSLASGVFIDVFAYDRFAYTYYTYTY